MVKVTARTSPFTGGVVYDVYDCFVDRHKETAPSKGQAWRLSRSPCNSANRTNEPDVSRSLQRQVSTIQTVELTADVCVTILRGMKHSLHALPLLISLILMPACGYV